MDSEPWFVHRYSSETGDCVLVRGKAAESYVDQFEFEKKPEGNVLKRESTTTVYERSLQVRTHVLARAKGYCEWCGGQGFKTTSGAIYLETHHVQPLSEQGRDTSDNVIALCPNHHRQAHFGDNSEQFKQALLSRVKMLNKSTKSAANAPTDLNVMYHE